MSKPTSILPSLERLREYMYGFYPERRESDPFPLEFWKIDDDDLFFEFLSYLPLMMEEAHEEGVAHLPEGFRLAYPVMLLEDDYQFNGWTALSNAGERLLPQAIAAYERMGLPTEAAALRAALAAVRLSPRDDDAAEAAYKSVPNSFADDDARNEALLKFFGENRRLFEAST
jgi:hypothetical protein